MSAEGVSRNAITAVIALAVLALMGAYFFRSLTDEAVAGENDYRLGNRQLADGDAETALRTFESAISKNPGYASAYLGKAIALMHLKRPAEAFASFEQAIEIEPGFAEVFANRGILNDREGRYEQALADYRKALQLKPELGKGPGMIWRFLHSPGEKPSTLPERAAYIEQELKKPIPERRLRQAEQDSGQKMYAK
jgi:Tfp pilus assembly protein PilF